MNICKPKIHYIFVIIINLISVILLIFFELIYTNYISLNNYNIILVQIYYIIVLLGLFIILIIINYLKKEILNNNKVFIVKYTCICQENPKEAKKVPLHNLLSNKEPINTCNIHQNNKLISFCRKCHKAISNICELHKGHSLENNTNSNINKKDAD